MLTNCVFEVIIVGYDVYYASAVVAQQVEHFLGKEEVGSSSLLNSSICGILRMPKRIKNSE